MGCVFLVRRLGFNCEVDFDEINFIVWTGIGKKKKKRTGKELFSTVGQLCSLVNARGIKAALKYSSNPKGGEDPSRLGRK